MWKRIVPLLIVLSVTLNVGIAGVWVAHALHGYWITLDQPDEGGEGVWCPLHRSLGVTDEQWKRIESGLTQFQRDSRALCQEVNRKRGELIDLIASPQPDREAIAAKQEEILAGQREMQKRVIARLLTEKETLTAEQQAKFFQMIKEKVGCAGRIPMVGSGLDSGSASSTPDECRK
jgi:Spy/CpxP family protein refolding chaperone